jgi:hypothetical protein
MRNDHVFYGLVGGRHPTPEELEHHMREAHKLRARAFGELTRSAGEWLAGVFRRRPARPAQAKLQHC